MCYLHDAIFIAFIYFAVFILETGFHVYVWIGKEATSHEKGSGLTLAHVSST